ncbi:hypothetical protein GCM10018966_006330 [Streptomyces yanii]
MGGIRTAKDTGSRLARGDTQPVAITYAEQRRRHGPRSGLIAHSGHSSQPGIQLTRMISSPATIPAYGKACSEQNALGGFVRIRRKKAKCPALLKTRADPPAPTAAGSLRGHVAPFTQKRGGSDSRAP